MAIYRTIQLSFWTDSKVVDDFTPEDRYFYLYLMTNPHTSLCGCYEVSIRQISIETGYSKDVVERLIDRMEKVHDVVRYNKDTKEILILNWYKYNWTKSPKLKPAIESSIGKIKTKGFADYLSGLLDGIDTVSIPYTYPSDTSVTVHVHENTDNYLNDIREIIDYLNKKINTNYRYTTKSTKEHVHARLKEGYTVDDFKKVIDNKSAEWMGTEMEKYLRPETLFAAKHFDGYLNQKTTIKEKVRLEDL